MNLLNDAPGRANGMVTPRQAPRQRRRTPERRPRLLERRAASAQRGGDIDPKLEGATTTPAKRADEIEALRRLMSRYARWGDTQQWDRFRLAVHDDAVVIIDAGPRPNPESDPRVELHRREALVAGMSASLEGVHTAHNLLPPDIIIDDAGHAHAIWGYTITSRLRSSTSTATGTSATTTSRSTGSGRSSAGASRV